MSSRPNGWETSPEIVPTDQVIRVRLGSFELNLQTGELRSLDPNVDFRKLFLPEKPFRLLRMLIELAGKLASREEIQKRLWPNDTVVDFEHGINVAIASLRRAFGDSASDPKYIETVPRRGYRLVVQAEWIAVDADSDGQGGNESTSKGPTAESSPQSLIGKKVSHFRVIEVIGGGGMGMVYKAEDLKLGRQVALKFLPEEMAADPVALMRFEREAQTASALNHPNICTIFEIEEYEGQPIIVMELLNGETLRDRLEAPGQEGLPLDELLRIALQTCDGLQVAHDKGIIHRDIKPANLFLTTEGPAKILDFGLAKLIAAEETGQSVQQDAMHATSSSIEPGLSVDPGLSRGSTAMGTTKYMSPEQLSREKLDLRTDLFSFGLVLHEMAAGRRSNSASSGSRPHGTSAREQAAPVRDLNPAVPVKLQAIIAKALQENRTDRYSSAAEMRADLESIPSPRMIRLIRIRNWISVATVVVLIVIMAFAYWRYRNRFQLSAADTIVIADLTNQTSDPVIDDALNIALPVELAQTPFLQVLAQDKVRETMSQLKYPLGGKVTPDIARQVCLKTNSKAVITTVIADAGNHFRILLNGVSCQTGQIFAHSEEDAILRAGIVHALGDAGAQLRGRMGEPNDSLRKFNKPLDLATSASPEALQFLAQGFKKQQSRDIASTIPLYERAIDIDPSFALAYATVGISYSYLDKHAQSIAAEKKAYDLRDRLTGQLRFLVETLYYDVGLGDLQRSVPVYEEWIRIFPLDGVGHNNFAACLIALGDYDRAAYEAREAVRLMPLLRDGSYDSLMRSATFADRLEEAKTIFDEARTRKLDGESMHDLRFLIAFLQRDDSEMQKEITWLHEHGIGPAATFRKWSVDAYYGQFRDASRRLQPFKGAQANSDIAARARFAFLQLALQETEAGDTAGARRLLASRPDFEEPNEKLKIDRAMIFARMGEIEQSGKLSEEIRRESPQDTLVQSYLLATIRGSIALDKNDPASAIESLRTAKQYELAFPYVFNSLYPAYIRGLAYLQLGNNSLAIAEFQKLLDHPAIVGRWDTGVLVYLQLGRAEARMGDQAAARKYYRTFLTIWKDADPNLPALIHAKAELATLH